MKRAWYLVGLAVMGCGGPSAPKASPILAAHGPSDEEYVDYVIDSNTVVTKDKGGQTHQWRAKQFQSDGEEKLEFVRSENEPSIESRDTDLPTITFGKSFEGDEAFKSVLRNFTLGARAPVFSIAKFGFGPFGSSNDLYFGHTFWDLDVWMMPAMILLAPDSARAAAQYRIGRAQQAHINYLDWAKIKGEKFANDGMKFPWESSVTGKEVCLQKTKRQEHISGDVVWGLTQAEAMGLAEPKDVTRISRAVSVYYDARSTNTNRGKEIQDVVSPNEKFEGNNDLYTNMLAQWVSCDRRWNTKGEYVVPQDKRSLLNYDGDPLKDYQQAAGLLAIYPLQCPRAEGNARAMMDRFAGQISPSGPAMGQAVTATIWARLGEKEKAYQAWIESWKPFLKGPNNLFSERRTAVRPYFFTGAAGAIDTVLYGFLGFRIDRFPLPGAKWTKRLKSGWWLSAKPCVPDELGSITIKDLNIDGTAYKVTATSSGDFNLMDSK